MKTKNLAKRSFHKMTTTQFHLTSRLVLLFSLIAICGTTQYEQLREYEKLMNYGLLRRMADYYELKKNYDLNQCSRDIQLWKNSLGDMWTLEMIDAAGKFPHGILKGNIYALGQFDQCLAVRHQSSERLIKGKYCPMSFAVSNLTLNVGDVIFNNLGGVMPQASVEVVKEFNWLSLISGVCMPDSCSGDDLSIIFAEFWINETSRPMVSATDLLCSVDEPRNWNGLQISAVVVFSMIGCFIICSTIYELFTKFYFKKELPGHDFLIAFSLHTNTEKLTTIKRSSKAINCLHGMRTISMLWVILGHRYFGSTSYPIANVVDALAWSQTYSAMFVVGANVAVDTFFVMSGLLLAYLFLSAHENKKSTNLGLFYFHRFIRLWPAMAALVYFKMTLLDPVIGSGPTWPFYREATRAPCEDYWYSTLLYIQNYLYDDAACITVTWYLAIDTQLYVLSPILLIPLIRYKRVGVINMIFWFIASQVAVITIVYTHNWSALIGDDLSYWSEYYEATQARAAAWMIGFIGGYLIYRTKNIEITINKYLVAFLWIASLSILWIVVFGVKNMNAQDHVPTHLQDSTFSTFARSAWAIALVWVIFACMKGYGGPINWLLSLPALELIGRLSYSMYLTHPQVQVAKVGLMRAVPHFSNFEIIYVYFGDVVMTLAVSYFWAMAFEYPFLAIERALIHKKRVAAPVLPKTVEKDENAMKDITMTIPDKIS